MFGGDLAVAKRDLDILQLMGLVPGDTRPGWELFLRLLQKVESTVSLCANGRSRSATWRGCPDARGGDFNRLKKAGIDNLFSPRSSKEKAKAKRVSAKDMYNASILRIRPHHLMCMACFHGGRGTLAPIAEDNLFEAIDIIRRNPSQPVELIQGCCMICVPCSHYDPATNQCVRCNSMSLRDEKKDLDLLSRLGLSYGVILPARVLYRRLFRTIRSTKEICGYGDGQIRSWEWTICSNGPNGNESYRKARACGMGFVRGYRDKAKRR
jgi:hypothetical protein